MLSHVLIARYGMLVVFLNVLGSSLGLPLPVIPTLITVAAGIALTTHAVSSALPHFRDDIGRRCGWRVLGDLVWFQGGKRYGERTLHTVCKLSLSRETCVRKTERFFGRWGVRVLVVARFVPDLWLVAVPLCGALGVRCVPMPCTIAHVLHFGHRLDWLSAQSSLRGSTWFSQLSPGSAGVC
jgi:membrane protein DedA with SNARE-associated domain